MFAVAALASCIDEHDGECNLRDYSDLRRIDMAADPDLDPRSHGRSDNGQDDPTAEPDHRDSDPATL